MNERTSSERLAAHRLPLGKFVLDVPEGELVTVDGQRAGIRKQALEVLLVLGRRPGHVVGKDELMAAVWPQVVVGDGSLTQAVTDIRHVLGDDDHRLVRNVARRGYMLVPDVSPTVPDAALAPTPATTQALPSSIEPTIRPTTDRLSPSVRTPVVPALVASGVLVLLLLVGLTGWVASRQAGAAWVTPAMTQRHQLSQATPELSIAVLPLALEGNEGEGDWLADALHGDLVTEISRLVGSLVIARDTVASYKGRVVDPRQVSRELGVRHIVRGSLRQEGADLQDIRLNLTLVDGETGVQNWADTFIVPRAQLQRTVGEFAVQIERALQAELYRTTAARRESLSPQQVSADDLAMRAFALWYRGVTRDNLTQALSLLERAVMLDPDSVRGWAGVNFMHLQALSNGWVPDRAAALTRIAMAAEHLDRLDRDGHYTHQAKTIQLYLKRDVAGMLQMTSAWTQRYAHPVAYGAHGAALMFNGRFDEAAQAQEKALRLSPRDPFRAEWQYRLAMAHFAAGRYELARQWAQLAAQTNPGLAWPCVHAAALVQLNELDAARQVLADHEARHRPVDLKQLAQRIPGDDPPIAQARQRLLSSLEAARRL